MTKQTLNLEIGETYSASHILSEINNYSSLVQIGHAVIKIKGENRHLYHIDLNKKKLENLKDTELKVLSIVIPCEQNFANKFIFSEETLLNLKKIEENKKLSYVIDMNDLKKVNYRFNTLKCAITCINCVFKKNEMNFIASFYSEGNIDRKHYIKISYKLNDINDSNENKNCEIDKD